MLNKDFLPKKVNKKQEYLSVLWAVLFFIGVVLVIYFTNHNSLGKIKEKHVYTVGTIRGYSPARTGKMLNYTIAYKDSIYVGGFKFYGKDERFTIGNRFLVILSPDNPETKFFIPYLIPKDVDAPPEGWKDPPLDITEADVMRYLEEKY